MALTQSAIFPLQAIAGGVLATLFGIFGIKLFPTFGFLAALGFEEGPGQALSIGKVWQGFGFEHATTIGLTFAAMGFFFVLVNGPLWWDWSIGTTLLIFLGLMILALGLIRVLKFWGTPKF